MLVDRRTFLRLSWGAVALAVTPAPGIARVEEWMARQGPRWGAGPGKARYRIDGIAKVMGHKIYARDLRARDLPGWPARERVGYVLRADRADRPWLGYDLSMLPAGLTPQIITQATLDADQIQNVFPDTSPPGSAAGNRPQSYFVGQGQVPVYLGQPVALLLFEDAAACAAARRLLQFDPAVLRYGDPVPPASYPPYNSPLYLTLYPGPDGKPVFSQTLVGHSDPNQCTPAPPASDDPAASPDCRAAYYRALIDAELADPTMRGWTLHTVEATTQTLDPLFMEPEAGLGWYRTDTKTLSLALGTQSPDGDLADALDTLFAKAPPDKQVSAVELVSCYPGGGFGGRDVSNFPPLMMLAAIYSPDVPVRIANDRFEQFQSGLKQLGASISQTLAVDADGRFQANTATQKLFAGGKNNYSQFVAELAGYCASNAYAIPRAKVDAGAEPSVGVPAGSMRGFGGPQAMFATELLVDQIAAARGDDPIELRRRNILRRDRGDTTVTGAPLVEPLRLEELLRRAQDSPLWARRRPPGVATGTVRVGVGFALANQAYGTGSDGVFAAVAIDRDGKLTVSSNAVDMGNGSATTLALATAGRLGANADAIEMGQVALFNAIDLSSDPQGQIPAHIEGRKRSHVLYRRLVGRAATEHPWDDPRYTPTRSMSSSACITAFQQVHAVEQAARVLYETGLWPAAAAAWKLDPRDIKTRDACRWKDGALTLAGHPPLPRAALAADITAAGRVAGAMVHACYQAQWVRATYPGAAPLAGYAAPFEGPIDGLALQKAGGAYTQILRATVDPPPPLAGNYGRSLYAPSATIAAVEVDTESGRVRVTDLHTWLDAGTVHQPDLLSGMYQGGAAMGIGYALLEDIPLTAAGGGSGTWNLDRYHVALADDVPLASLRLELLPPDPQDPHAKGIAEAVLCPIAPAIVNAVNNALGSGISAIPVTPAVVRGVAGGTR